MRGAITRRALLRGAVGTAALAASGGLGCGGAREAAAPSFEPLRLAYGGFAMGLQSFSLRHYRLEAALDIVARLGLAHVELIPETKLLFFEFGTHFAVTEDAEEIDRVLAAAAARGVAIAAHGVNGIGDLAEAKRLLAFATRARIPVLSVMPDASVVGPELDALLAASQVKLAIHNHGPELPYETIAEVEGALAGRHPNLGACVDAGHFIRAGEDPVEAIRRLGSRVHGVHLKDYVSEGAFADGCILGRGKLDLGAVFDALREVGYANALSLEYEQNPENVVPDLVACLQAASEAAERTARS